MTDTKGETEEAGTSIPIYSGKATPALQIPEQVNKQQRTAFHISLEEIGNDSSAYPVKYTIQKLVSPKQLQTNLEIKDTIVEKNILEGHLAVFRKDSIFPDLTQQTSGIYLFTVECNQIKTNRVFFSIPLWIRNHLSRPTSGLSEKRPLAVRVKQHVFFSVLQSKKPMSDMIFILPIN